MTLEEYLAKQERIRRYNPLNIVDYLKRKYQPAKVATYPLENNNQNIMADEEKTEEPKEEPKEEESSE